MWCPPGWQHLVERLCSALDYQVKTPRQLQKWALLFEVHNFIFKKMFAPINNWIYRRVDPFESMHWRDGKRENWTMIHPETRTRIEAEHPKRVAICSLLRKVSLALRPKMRWNYVKVPPITIDQVKEKFGTLRFYYEGGDERTAAMISMVERISEVTCEESGAPGTSCVRGGWWKTLSPEVAKNLGYTPAK
jgi:hypothetical protein